MEQMNYAYAVFSSTESLTSEAVVTTRCVELGRLFENEYIDSDSIETLKANLITSLDGFDGIIRVILSDCDSEKWSKRESAKVAAESNPQLGVRGVSRFAQHADKMPFSQECDVIKSLKLAGLNVEIVVPFVRTLSDAAKIIDLLAEQGLPRGMAGQKVLFRVDTPSSALLSEKLLHYFDGVVIHQDHLTQYTLAVDKENTNLAYLFDVENDAIIELIQRVTEAAERVEKPVQITVSHWHTEGKLAQWLPEHPHVGIGLDS